MTSCTHRIILAACLACAFVQADDTTVTPAQEATLVAAAATTATEVEKTIEAKEITLEDAIVLAGDIAKDLEVGKTFEFEGTTYKIVAPKAKTVVEKAEEAVKEDDKTNVLEEAIVASEKDNSSSDTDTTNTDSDDIDPASPRVEDENALPDTSLIGRVEADEAAAKATEEGDSATPQA